MLLFTNVTSFPSFLEARGVQAAASQAGGQAQVGTQGSGWRPLVAGPLHCQDLSPEVDSQRGVWSLFCFLL